MKWARRVLVLFAHNKDDTLHVHSDTKSPPLADLYYLLSKQHHNPLWWFPLLPPPSASPPLRVWSCSYSRCVRLSGSANSSGQLQLLPRRWHNTPGVTMSSPTPLSYMKQIILAFSHYWTENIKSATLGFFFSPLLWIFLQLASAAEPALGGDFPPASLLEDIALSRFLPCQMKGWFKLIQCTTETFFHFNLPNVLNSSVKNLMKPWRNFSLGRFLHTSHCRFCSADYCSLH